jgi:lysophospholipase L1-like esterase
MQRVILIGDSIRGGYEATVREELSGEAEIWAPTENGGTSAKVLANLDAWALSQPASIVHLNAGLHDIKKDFGAAENNIPVAQYRQNLEEIFGRLSASAHTPVWVTTTPVNEAWHHARKGFDRFEADVAAYNAVALEVAEALSLPVHDLHAVVTAAGRDTLLRDDGVHYTPEGSAALGHAVAVFLRRLDAG